MHLIKRVKYLMLKNKLSIILLIVIVIVIIVSISGCIGGEEKATLGIVNLLSLLVYIKKIITLKCGVTYR